MAVPSRILCNLRPVGLNASWLRNTVGLPPPKLCSNPARLIALGAAKNESPPRQTHGLSAMENRESANGFTPTAPTAKAPLSLRTSRTISRTRHPRPIQYSREIFHLVGGGGLFPFSLLDLMWEPCLLPGQLLAAPLFRSCPLRRLDLFTLAKGPPPAALGRLAPTSARAVPAPARKSCSGKARHV